MEAGRIGRGDEGDRRDEQHQPQRLGPHLELGQGGHPVEHQRDDDQRADDVTQGQRQMERQLHRLRHDRPFEGEEDEAETGVDQAGQCRPEISEARAPGEQVHVDVVLRGVVGDRDAGEEDGDGGDQDRHHRAGRTMGDRDGGADRIVGQVGDTAEGGHGAGHRAPLAERFGRIAQGKVLDGVLAGPVDEAGPRPAAGRRSGGMYLHLAHRLLR